MRKFSAPLFAAIAAACVMGNASAYSTFTGQDVWGFLNSQPTAADIPNSTGAEAAFTSNLGSYLTGFESFGNIDVGTTAPLSLDFGAVGKVSMAAGTGSVEGNFDSARLYSAPGDTHYWKSQVGPDGFTTLDLTFSRAVAGFGFYGIDLGDIAFGSIEIQLFDGTQLVKSLSVPTLSAGVDGEASGSIIYFGFLADSESEFFDHIRFVTSGNSSDQFAFDNFTVAATSGGGGEVPEPASLALVSAALLAVWASRRGASR